MPLSRRAFLELLGGSTAYAFAAGCGTGDDGFVEVTAPAKGKIGARDHAVRHFIDYTEWIVIHPDGSVTAYTGRIEMGQGLKTVLMDLVSQGLELPREKIEVVLGDTDLCPDDGPTEGSNATRIVGWRGFWRACERIRGHLVERAAKRLGVPPAKLRYADGAVIGVGKRSHRIGIGELADGTVHLGTLDPRDRYVSARPYEDRGTPPVNGEAIVTGTLAYAGDLFCGEAPYGSWRVPPYHAHLTRAESLDLERARRQPGVDLVAPMGNTAMAIGSSFRGVERCLEKAVTAWSVPKRPLDLKVEEEIRARAKLKKVIEERGTPDDAFTGCRVDLAETYITQYASQAPMETETAIAEIDGDRATVWTSTQAPFKARASVAETLRIPEENVRIISLPVGGGFGVKVGTQAPKEAAQIARVAGRKVKLVYSREHQFVGRSRYKEAVVADLRSGVGADGRIVARTLDLHQDEGFGSTGTYDIPNVRSRLFRSPMPGRHGTMRGTSFVQTCFAVESHTDSLADALGVDPVEFRLRNIAEPAFGPLLDACADMIGYRSRRSGDGRGIGFGICHHGGRQLGATAAEVSVDRTTGVVRVERLAGAFDIGIIVNRNTLGATVTGAMIWGLGYALFEEVEMDGHRCHTRGLGDYRIPRFSDVPPIELAFFDNVTRAHAPRGCGELPVITAAAAIANAVARAVGVRFHTLPITPDRVLAAIGTQRGGNQSVT